MRIVLIITFISTHLFLFAQLDSVPTLKLQRIDKGGKTKEKIINPLKKKITFITKNGLKYRLDSNTIIEDTLIKIDKEYISINNVRKVSVRNKNNILKYIVGILIMNEGSLAISYGLIATIAPYKSQNNDQVLTNLAISGAGFLTVATGLEIIFINKSYDTKNKWKIKSGYYKFNRDI